MKILWSVNTLMPKVAQKLGIKSSHAISWVDAMSNRLKDKENIDIAIVSPTKNKVVSNIKLEGIKYYLINENSTTDDWNKIIDDFNPDVIHLYGTEKQHNMPLVKMDLDIPIVISLQGILTEYERFYYGGIDISTLIKNITIRDLVRGTIFKERKNFKKAAIIEREMLRSVKYVEGRTDWDRVASMNINNNLIYYHCPRLIREAFYNSEHWSPDNMEPYSIFIHQGNYPIKGLHFVLEALNILKYKYPNVKLYIAGNDIINRSNFKQKLLRNGYSKYLKSLVKKYDLESNIIFTGYLSAEKLAKKLLNCNVMVISSAIENSPNSLAEAELVGIPCIASYVGGNPEMLKDGEEGFLYCFNEPGILADKISKIFDSSELAKSFSSKAIKSASKRHNAKDLENRLIGIYKDMIIREEKNRKNGYKYNS
ncbi:glycosyltransferase family 4 protein [Clostridium perfringens]|uniref:glycosyltransferase family 4 protein n=1 Tax=Clostridium perfringens TaxID=1502 RepID=UPI0022E01D56|nr:glycosyltransferase family 4 protein [Clostridium perfringens]